VKLSLPPGSREPLPTEAELVVIGGGIMGLATAYNAACLGLRDIVVLERSYLCSGASGRNGGGVRMQWSSSDNVALMKDSIEICKHFAADMGVNIWFRQGGYLFLAKTPAAASTLEANVRVQNQCGVGTMMLTPVQAREVVPELSIEGIVAASYNPEDGVLFPWPFLWGYAERAIELGVRIHTFIEVTGLEMSGDQIARVITDRGAIAVQHVVNATGAWSPVLAKMAGVAIPNAPHRHEILTTEPLKPFLGPLVTVLGDGIYFSQSMRGEIVGGMGDPDEPPGYDTSSTLGFLRRFARASTALIPALGNVQVVRQWAGLYDVSPDGRPILGEPAAARNMTLLSGFTGHGFMMGPIIGKLCAERLVRGARVAYFEENGPDRFEHGIGANRETMIIG
jgi:sarcosine oxidase subunit beta